ncbi:energy-coupling factor ABC transporter permease [Luteimonas composti]|uniref:Energy-coupling factor ABC transporter permease n=1 Tax=Luteimonas composti TaxID=398257 RepID=A0ABT6MTP0_9GAMM|nr:energy-coupling factor ABC transporter permease [Luteimonas composti]MDH7454009.1 energy-coupling factor ABC transporter permease [Luteimonas composti]
MDATLPGWTLWPAWLVATLVLARALPSLRHHAASLDEEGRRVLVLATLALAAMRWFNTAALQGVMLHFLGATIATLMFGASTACWAMALVSLAGLLLGAAWQGWAMDFLATGALPVAVTALVSWAARTWLPRNVFTYIMLNAFAAGALAMAASMLAKAAVTALLGGRALAAYLVATPMLMFAEAFFAGTVMALVVVYRPHWCRSFDDRAYLWPERRM